MKDLTVFSARESGAMDLGYALAVALIAIGVIMAFSGISGTDRLLVERVGGALQSATAVFADITGPVPAKNDDGIE